MKVIVQIFNFVVDQKFINFIERKLNKLEQFFDKIIFVDVFLKVQKISEKENKLVEILFSVFGGDFIVKKEVKIFEVGIDECV